MYGSYAYGAGYYGQGPALTPVVVIGPSAFADVIIQVRADDVVFAVRSDDVVVCVKPDDDSVQPT